MCMVQKRELKYRMIDILILFLINLMTLTLEVSYHFMRVVFLCLKSLVTNQINECQ